MNSNKLKTALDTNRTLIIAEIGNNHLGKGELAHQHIEAAAEAGVDAVKFQMFQPDRLVTSDMPVYKHVPDRSIKSQRARFEAMSLPIETFASLCRHATEKEMLFLCTPFDEESVDRLYPLVSAYKIASGDATFFPLVDYVKNKGKPMLVSTGLCSQNEVDNLVDRLPKERTILFHCVGAYPTPDQEACLSMIPFYVNRYGLPVGYSDHTPDALAALAAVTLGAVAIEKHFILDRQTPGGDLVVSLTPPEMKGLVQDIRRLEKMLGNSPRTVQPCEIYGRMWLRRSAYNIGLVKEGDILKMQDIVFLRPAVEGAYSPSDLAYDSILCAKGDLLQESPLTPQNTEWINQS